MGSTPAFVVFAVLLEILAGLAVAAEAALSSFSKARADELIEEGRPGSKRLRSLLDDPARFLSSLLLLRLVFELTAVVLVSFVIFGLGWPVWLELVTAAGVMVILSFVFLGVAPRTLGRQRADSVACASAGILTVATRILGPLPQLLIVIGNALTPGRGFRQGPFASEAELREYVDLAADSQLIESGESKMVHSVFELADTIVRSVMVPRPDVVYIEQDKQIRQALSLALRSGYSRIPVVGESLDDVVGMAYLKDLARRTYNDGESASQPVSTVMREVLFVPDSMPADDLLRRMQSERRHVAIVVDEYGGTSGLVTIEDVLEEIVGEITDEYDRMEVPVEQLEDGSVRVSTRLNISELGDVFDIDLEDDDVDSVGGLMAKHLNMVPIPGSEVDVDGLHLLAEEGVGRRNRPGTVRVWQIGDRPADDAEGAS
jgi:CBS domain containing-hemolysin-like protein